MTITQNQQVARRREAARAIARAAGGTQEPRRSAQPSANGARPSSNPLTVLGGLLLATGLIWLILTLNMDTSVSTGSSLFGIERVNNVGLMNQKTNHTIASSALCIVGTLLVVAGILRERRS
jgi:hypothetical protein